MLIFLGGVYQNLRQGAVSFLKCHLYFVLILVVFPRVHLKRTHKLDLICKCFGLTPIGFCFLTKVGILYPSPMCKPCDNITDSHINT